MEISNCNTQYHTVSITQSFKTENQIKLNPRQIYMQQETHSYCCINLTGAGGYNEVSGGVIGRILSIKFPGFLMSHFAGSLKTT